MPRGGKRAGAGCKPGRTLPQLERMRIGGHCERLWREACKENEEQAVSEKLREVRKEWAKAQAVPVSDRKRWLGSKKHEKYLENVEFALCEDQDIAGKAFLLELLATGPVPLKRVKAKATEAEFLWATVQRAQKALGIVATKEGGFFGTQTDAPKWVWKLPITNPESLNEHLQSNDADGPDRVVRIRPTRPKGPRNSIIKQVAKEETLRLGKRVSKSMVARCWKEFRRIEKDTDL